MRRDIASRDSFITIRQSSIDWSGKRAYRLMVTSSKIRHWRSLHNAALLSAAAFADETVTSTEQIDVISLPAGKVMCAH